MASREGSRLVSAHEASQQAFAGGREVDHHQAVDDVADVGVDVAGGEVDLDTSSGPAAEFGAEPWDNLAMARRLVVLIVTLLQVVAFAALVTWRAAHWHRVGWAGFTYTQAVSGDEGWALERAGGTPGEVTVLAPGSPAALAGLRQGDVVVTVGDLPITAEEEIAELDRRLVRGDELAWTVERAGEELTLAVRLTSPLASPLVVAGVLTSLAVGLVWLVISLLVVWAKPEAAPARVFYAMCATGAAAYLVWAVAELDYPGLRGVVAMGSSAEPFVLIGVTTLLSVALASLILHMALIFPRRRPLVERWPQVVVWVHALPFLPLATGVAFIGGAVASRTPWGVLALALVEVGVAVAAVRTLFRVGRVDGWLTALVTRPWRCMALVLVGASIAALALRLLALAVTPFLVGVLFGLGFVVWFCGQIVIYTVAAVVVLYRSYVGSGRELRIQIRWPMWGTATTLVAALVIIGVGLAASILARDTVDAYYMALVSSSLTKVIYLFIPMSFAFAILKYRLLDIEVVIRKTVVYSGLTAFVLVVYLGLAGLSGLVLVRSAGVQNQAATVLATIIVVALFVPVRGRIQSFVDRRYFRRARDLDEVRERVARTLADETESERALLARVADLVQVALRCRFVAVLTAAPGAGKLVANASVGVADDDLGGLVVDRSAPVLLDPSPRLLEREAVAGPGVLPPAFARIRPELVAVGRVDEVPVAVAVVGGALDGRGYDDDERRFVTAVATCLETAVARTTREHLDGELAQARQLQRSSLPRELPRMPGVSIAAHWEPAREVSGDAYDAFALAPDRLLVCIGDVVGKGLPAAFLMSNLQAAVRAVAQSTDSPAEVCRRVRAVLEGSLSGGRFVTFFCVTVTATENGGLELRAANAGHNLPLLLGADGSYRWLSPGGPAMTRILAAQGYDDLVLSLRRGDRLVLYTDGVVEAMSPSGELFGDERMAGFLAGVVSGSAEALKERLLAAVLDHTAGILHDDLTIVVVAVDEEAAVRA